MVRELYSEDVLLELIGMEEVEKAVSELGEFDKQQQAVNKGFRDAGRYLIRKGRLRLRQRMKSGTAGVTGNLLRSFSFRIKKRSQKLGVIVGFKRNQKEGKLGYHAHLVSEGTRERKTKKGFNRGRTTPNLFWSDTRKEDGDEARLILLKSIEASIQIIKNRYNAE